jgi:hypothetical protein
MKYLAAGAVVSAGGIALLSPKSYFLPPRCGWAPAGRIYGNYGLQTGDIIEFAGDDRLWVIGDTTTHVWYHAMPQKPFVPYRPFA